MNTFGLDIGVIWLWANFFLYLLAFGVALYINRSFNIWMVGTIYFVPLVPFGYSSDALARFTVVSFQNTVFGIIELVIFCITVKEQDVTFSKDQIKQLLGHTLPIALALIGLSYYSRSVSVPLSTFEVCAIMTLFFIGAVFRVLAVYQLGAVGFKFDIVFRDQQKLMTEKLYSFMRHPSYTAMMIVILSYAVTTHSLIAGTLGLLSGWFGFQYRIHFEESALKERFGKEYDAYRARTPMWLPFPGRSGEGTSQA